MSGRGKGGQGLGKKTRTIKIKKKYKDKSGKTKIRKEFLTLYNNELDPVSFWKDKNGRYLKNINVLKKRRKKTKSGSLLDSIKKDVQGNSIFKILNSKYHTLKNKNNKTLHNKKYVRMKVPFLPKNPDDDIIFQSQYLPFSKNQKEIENLSYYKNNEIKKIKNREILDKQRVKPFVRKPDSNEDKNKVDLKTRRKEKFSLYDKNNNQISLVSKATYRNVKKKRRRPTELENPKTHKDIKNKSIYKILDENYFTLKNKNNKTLHDKKYVRINIPDKSSEYLPFQSNPNEIKEYSIYKKYRDNEKYPKDILDKKSIGSYEEEINENENENENEEEINENENEN